MFKDEDWLVKVIKQHRSQCMVIPIKKEILDFCGGDYHLAAILTQLLYWHYRTRIKGGWIAKSSKDWNNELSLSQKQINRIVKRLKDCGLVIAKVKKFNGSPTTHYRLDVAALEKVFTEYLQSGNSILSKRINSIDQKEQMDLAKRDKSILPKGTNSINQKEQMDLVKRNKSITEITTELNSKINSEHKTERDFSVFEEIYFDDIKSSDVVPKEKSCGKKEKVVLPFESSEFEQLWGNWKVYRFEKYQKTYSIIEEQAALMPLQNYDEDFSNNLILKAISGGWKSFHFSDTPNQFQTHLIKKNKNYEQSGKEFRANEFKNAVDERSEELWGNFG
jgi:hypothetical protein